MQCTAPPPAGAPHTPRGGVGSEQEQAMWATAWQPPPPGPVPAALWVTCLGPQQAVPASLQSRRGAQQGCNSGPRLGPAGSAAATLAQALAAATGTGRRATHPRAVRSRRGAPNCRVPSRRVSPPRWWHRRVSHTNWRLPCRRILTPGWPRAAQRSGCDCQLAAAQPPPRPPQSAPSARGRPSNWHE